MNVLPLYPNFCHSTKRAVALPEKIEQGNSVSLLEQASLSLVQFENMGIVKDDVVIFLQKLGGIVTIERKVPANFARQSLLLGIV